MSFHSKFTLLFGLLLGGLCSACYPDYRECPCSYQDTRRRFYSQALTEIVEHELYSSYLADVPAYRQADTSDLPYLLNSNDSSDHRVIWCNQQLAIAQNRLFQDTAHFQTLYLDTTSRRSFNWNMRGHDAGENAFWEHFITDNGFKPPVLQSAIDSLCTLQQAVRPRDFQTCTFRVKLAMPHQRTDTAGTIGVIYLSKPLFDAKRQRALLAYDYHCGPRCGFTQTILLENHNNRWLIQKAQIMSIY